MTPPPAMVPLIRVSNSSSPLIASCKCLGVILFTFRSLLAFPASSRTSAVRYSRIEAKYTAAVAPTRPLAWTLCFSCLWIRPTGNCFSNQIKKIKLVLYTILVGNLVLYFLLHYLKCLLIKKK